MEWNAIGVAEKKVKQFQRSKINTPEDLVYTWPVHHIDRTSLSEILVDQPEESRLIVTVRTVRYIYGNIPRSCAEVTDIRTSQPLTVIWWNVYPAQHENLKDTIGKQVFLCGQVKKVIWNEQITYQVSNPAIFSEDIQQEMRLCAQYKTVKGMSRDYYCTALKKAYDALSPIEDPLPEDVRAKYNLMEYQQAVQESHWTTSQAALEAAQQRILWNQLFYFASRIELNHRSMALGSPYQLNFLQAYRAARDSLPFTLTADQDSVIRDIISNIQTGRRTNALIQGDVGCGKTIVAFLLMIAFAENGYQAALMAPTQILAQQHYEKLVKMVEPLGFQVAFVSGKKLRKAEKAQLDEAISTGKIQLIVGTQALLSQDLQFSKLALCVTDEEHKYGVAQRTTLVEKAAKGVHVISMSATPIPRTLAQTIYGSHLQLYSIQTKPAGRKPVLTGIAKSMDHVFRHLLAVVKAGHQAYVVCPMIEKNDTMEGVESVESISQMYEAALARYGVKIGVVTGKTKKEDAAQIIADFACNHLHILICTTVIEVGVDVPNAVSIIIHNAERFGLAQLHQLRGRVGRGSLDSVCCLVSKDRCNERLAALCATTDGFQIAEADLKLRGAGDFLGTSQSGTEKYLALALAHPGAYRQAQEAVREMLINGRTCPLLEDAKKDNAAKVEGKMIV